MDIEHDQLASASRHASIWTATSNSLNLAPLDADLDVDVAVIGAGITGITTAALLAQTGMRIAVLEAGSVGGGTTGFSTGNLYASVDHFLYKLAGKWGQEKVGQVVQSRRMAIDLIEKNTHDFGIQCHFSRQPWTLYSLDADNDAVIDLEYQAAVKAGLAARISTDLPLPYHIRRALVVSHQAQFHPLLYVRQLAAAIRSERCQIFENTPVIDYDENKGTVSTPKCTVSTHHLVMATHTPKGFNAIQTQLGPYREYAAAAPLRSNNLPGGIFWGLGEHKHSTRLVEVAGQAYALMIGDMHKTGQSENPNASHRQLEAELQARFDVGPVAFRWSAQQYRPADGLPYIGPAIGSSRLYLASGFAADGLTYGTLAAMLISDQILGRKNAFVDLYSPRRFTPVKSATTFFKENLNVAGRYLKDYIKGAEAKQIADVPCGEGRIVEIDGDKLAVYRDDTSQVHIVSSVCTHLKCIVHWNQAEHSWDCPCHGSRFSYDGEVLEGPAMAPLQKRTTPPSAIEEEEAPGR